jgi:hypothetical protein
MSIGSISSTAPSPTAHKELISRFEKSFVFGPYFLECMESDRTLRGNCWSHQVLIENTNQLLEKYVRNPTQSTLDKFFRHYVIEKCPKKVTAHNYVIAFFLSIEHFAPLCFEVEAIQIIFTRDFPKGVIEDWWHIRDCCMLIHNLTGNLTTPLNTFFLTKSEYIVLIERVRNSERIKKDIEVWVGAREQEIKELRKYVRQHKPQFKQKLDKFEKHFKIGRTSASPICLQLLGYYVEDFEEDQAARARNPVVNKRDDGRDIHSDDVIVVDDDLNVIQKTRINDTAKPGHRLDLQQQKSALVDEIQQLTRESNTKRDVVLKLTGLLKAMDPVFLEAREKIEIARRKLLTLKRGVSDDEAKRMIFMEIGLEGLNFIDDGTKVKKDTHNSLLNTLKTENLLFSRDVSHRCQGYATEMARYRDMLREKIFADKELFRQVHVGKKVKHEQEFDAMNKGIDPDKLNQSDYITRKQDQELPDYEIDLDEEVDQVLEPADGAKEAWEEMLRRARGWDINPYSKEDLERRRSKNKAWEPYEDDDDYDHGYYSPNHRDAGRNEYFGDGEGPSFGGPGRNQRGDGRNQSSQNNLGYPGGAADEPMQRNGRNGVFESFGVDDKARGYDSFGPDSQAKGRDPFNEDSKGGSNLIDRNGRSPGQDGYDPNNRNRSGIDGRRDPRFGEGRGFDDSDSFGRMPGQDGYNPNSRSRNGLNGRDDPKAGGSRNNPNAKNGRSPSHGDNDPTHLNGNEGDAPGIPRRGDPRGTNQFNGLPGQNDPRGNNRNNRDTDPRRNQRYRGEGAADISGSHDEGAHPNDDGYNRNKLDEAKNGRATPRAAGYNHLDPRDQRNPRNSGPGGYRDNSYGGDDETADFHGNRDGKIGDRSGQNGDRFGPNASRDNLNGNRFDPNASKGSDRNRGPNSNGGRGLPNGRSSDPNNNWNGSNNNSTLDESNRRPGNDSRYGGPGNRDDINGPNDKDPRNQRGAADINSASDGRVRGGKRNYYDPNQREQDSRYRDEPIDGNGSLDGRPGGRSGPGGTSGRPNRYPGENGYPRDYDGDYRRPQGDDSYDSPNRRPNTSGRGDGRNRSPNGAETSGRDDDRYGPGTSGRDDDRYGLPNQRGNSGRDYDKYGSPNQRGNSGPDYDKYGLPNQRGTSGRDDNRNGSRGRQGGPGQGDDRYGSPKGQGGPGREGDSHDFPDRSGLPGRVDDRYGSPKGPGQYGRDDDTYDSRGRPDTQGRGDDRYGHQNGAGTPRNGGQNGFQNPDGRARPDNLQRDRYGNLINAEQPSSNSDPRGKRGYPDQNPGYDGEHSRNPRSGMANNLERGPYGQDRDSFRPISPRGTQGGNGLARDGYPANSNRNNYGSPDGRGYSPSSPKRFDPTDPLSIAGLDYGNSKPRGSGTGNSGSKPAGGNPAYSNRSPGEVHKATMGVTKGGATRRNVVKGDGDSSDKSSPSANTAHPADKREPGSASLVPPSTGDITRTPGGASSLPQQGVSPNQPPGQGGSSSPDGGYSKPAINEPDDDIVIADEIDFASPDKKELLPMNFDDDDDDQSDSESNSPGKLGVPANKIAAASGSVKRPSRRTVPDAEIGSEGVTDGNIRPPDSKPNLDVIHPDQPALTPRVVEKPSAEISGRDYEPSMPPIQEKPSEAAEGKPAEPTVPIEQAKPPEGNITPGGLTVTPPGETTSQRAGGSGATTPNGTKRRVSVFGKGGTGFAMDPPESSKVSRKSVRPDMNYLPPPPPPDQEKLTTLEDLVNASNTLEFEDKLGKYTQGKGIS